CCEFVTVNLGEDSEYVGKATVRDPHFLTIQNIVSAIGVKHGPRLGCQGVGTSTRFGQGKACTPLATRKTRQVLLFLRIGAEVDQRQRADCCMRSQRAGKRRHDADLFTKISRTYLVETESSVHLGNINAEKIEFTCF